MIHQEVSGSYKGETCSTTLHDTERTSYVAYMYEHTFTEKERKRERRGRTGELAPIADGHISLKL